jgi:hypothetical protein
MFYYTTRCIVLFSPCIKYIYIYIYIYILKMNIRNIIPIDLFNNRSFCVLVNFVFGFCETIYSHYIYLHCCYIYIYILLLSTFIFGTEQCVNACLKFCKRVHRFNIIFPFRSIYNEKNNNYMMHDYSNFLPRGSYNNYCFIFTFFKSFDRERRSLRRTIFTRDRR